MDKLIEVCCVCGFVHRDDREPAVRQAKLHYHWKPANGEPIITIGASNYRIHATICAEHVVMMGWNPVAMWAEALANAKATPPKYYNRGYNIGWSSNNAITRQWDQWADACARYVELNFREVR